MVMENYEISINNELTNVEGKADANGEQQKRKHNLSDLDSEDESNMEVAEAVIKRSIKICSLMFGKIFSAFDHTFKEQHTTNDKQMLFIVR